MLRTLFALLLFFVGFVSGGAAQTINGRVLVEPKLVADVSQITPGKPFTAALYLKIAPGWHTYWINSGDSGLPVSIEWKLPEGWKAGALQWPIPSKHSDPGDIVTYGYEDEVLLMAELTPPANVQPGEVTLHAKASWLVCEQSCIPGGAELDLALPVKEPSQASQPQLAESAQSAQSDLFAKFRARLPKAGPPPFVLKWEPHDTEVYLKISGIPADADLDFFPIATIPRHPELLSPGLLRISFPSPPDPPAVQGLLVVTPKNAAPEGWIVDFQGGKRPSQTAPSSASLTSPGQFPSTPLGGGMPLTLFSALGLGFVGGLILNLMPCVLPVIALKIFGFLGQVGESRRRVFRVGLAFVAGIFAWFLGLAALVVAARAAGHGVTWAFQFQNPWFVLGMAVLVFVFALNLLGIFELWLPGSGRLVSLSEKEGYGGAFLHGMFATLLATPCTAPFLGSALGFAFSQSAPVTFAMFAAIAAGMSLPYILLTARPGWMRFLPKPGLWMVRLKQFMGFLLLGTVVWLMGILAAQGGIPNWVSAFGAAWIMLGIGAACWIFGTWLTPGARPLRQVLALLGMAVMVLAGLFLSQPPRASGWEPWSPERVAALRREGKPIFVDFTADWCINCKYNERFVLDTEPVRAALHGFATLKADWTRGDPVISGELKRLGRAGVPVYAVYPAGPEGEPEVLPEFLTQGIVLEALKKAAH